MDGGRCLRWAGLAGVCLVMMTSSCSCEDRIRRWISNPEGERTTVIESEDASAEEISGDREPNDVPTQASAVDLKASLEPLEGRLSAGGDTDWFALQPGDDPPWLVELTITPTSETLDVAVDVEMDGPKAGRTTYEVAGSGEAESVPILQVPRGVRRIAVRAVDGTSGDYELQVKRRLSGGKVEWEPNDIRTGAVPMPFPGGIQGYYDRPGDRDYFHTARKDVEPGVYTVSVSPVEGLSHRAELFVSRDQTDPYIAFTIPPERERSIPNLKIPAGLDGLWLMLEAKEDGGKDQDAYARQSPYRIRAVKHAVDEGFTLEREPNDRDKTSQKVRLGRQVRGYLHHAGDRDRFSLVVGKAVEQLKDEAEAGGDDEGADAGGAANPEEKAEKATEEGNDAGMAPPRRLDEEEELEPAAEGLTEDLEAGEGSGAAPLETAAERLPDKEPAAHLLQVALKPNRKDDVLKLVWRNPESGGTRQMEADDPENPATLCNVPVNDGTLELEVTGKELAEDSFRGGFTYALAFADVVDKVEGIEVEPNDSRSSADPVERGGKRTGYIAHDGDRDVYGFVVPGEQGAKDDTEGGADAGTGSATGSTGTAMGSEGADAGAMEPQGPPAPPKPRSVTVNLRANRLDMGFELTDEQGGLIAEVDRAGAGANEQTSLDLPPGLYFVEVASGRGFECRPYEISVSVE